MADIKYHYALDEKKGVVPIGGVSKDTRHDHVYHCPGCGAEMVPRLGDVRTWHFAHAAGTLHCGTETYLHQLGKLMLKQKFDTNPEFKVGYYRTVYCSRAAGCPFHKREECQEPKPYEFDLKKFYDTCEMEKPVGDYIADLLLTSSQHPDREPVLIEIQNTHKVDAPKKKSGLRIIEVRIREEDDIRYLAENPIYQLPESVHGYYRDVETIGYGKFYNFKADAIAPAPLNCRSIPRFYLFRSGASFVTNMDEFRKCDKLGKRDNPKAILELDIDAEYLGNPSVYDYGYVKAMEMGMTVRACSLCKYRKNGYDSFYSSSPNFCCLHKKYGTPENPDNKEAANCGYYILNRPLIAEVQSALPSIPILVAQ